MGPALSGVQRKTQGGQGTLVPEEQQHSLWESLEVVVPVYLCPIHQGNLPKHLRSMDNQDTRVSSASLPPHLPLDLLPTLALISFQRLSLQATLNLKPDSLDFFLGHVTFFLSIQKPGRQFLFTKH